MTEKFTIVQAGEGLREVSTPTTPRSVQRRGGEPNPSVAAIEARFPGAIVRSEVIWGDTTIYVDPARVSEILRWLHDDPEQRYDYLSDVTAVEYRDFEAPVEVVWHIRPLPFRRFLRVKATIPRGGPLSVPSVWGIWKGADWLERECYDMFGIIFEGHPDLRRLLMWEQYKEGFPLRKDFPLRGRFSRAEQLRQALAQNIESRYSMEELTIADAFEDLPPDMRQRLSTGERTGE